MLTNRQAYLDHARDVIATHHWFRARRDGQSPARCVWLQIPLADRWQYYDEQAKETAL